MLVIRLQRIGKKNQPFFRVVLTEKTAPPKGKYIEKLGFLDPRKKNADLKADRIKYWMEKGAQASDTVWNLLIKKGIIEGEKRKIKIRKKKRKDGAKEEKQGEGKEESKLENQKQKSSKEDVSKSDSVKQTESKEGKTEEKTEEKTNRQTNKS